MKKCITHFKAFHVIQQHWNPDVSIPGKLSTDGMGSIHPKIFSAISLTGTQNRNKEVLIEVVGFC